MKELNNIKKKWNNKVVVYNTKWKTVTENYWCIRFNNSQRRFKSATHDFIILRKLFDEFGNKHMDKIVLLIQLVITYVNKRSGVMKLKI